MKSVLKISLLATAVIFAAGCQKESDTTVKVKELKTEEQKGAYAIGVSLAQYLKNNLEQQNQLGMKLDSNLVVQGVQDVFSGKPMMNEEETENTLKLLDQKVSALMETKAKADAEVAKKAGEDYRANFKKTEGVKTTDSGLMYKADKMGTGKKPTATDTVKVHYKGTLPDGTKFDSSYDRNEPVTFPLDRVIPGWTEGVQLMPVGSKFTFVIPPELAYGEQSTPTIPANSTLVFEVELLDIMAQDKPATQG